MWSEASRAGFDVLFMLHILHVAIHATCIEGPCHGDGAVELPLRISEVAADGRMSAQHGLDALAQCGDDRHRGKLALGVCQDVALEQVGKKMFFQETLYRGSELGVGGFRGIGGYAGDFGQYVASAVVAAAAVGDGRCVASGRVADALRLALAEHGDERLQGAEAARKAAVGVRVYQQLAYLAYRQAVVKSRGKRRPETLKVAAPRARRNLHYPLLPSRQRVRLFLRFLRVRNIPCYRRSRLFLRPECARSTIVAMCFIVLAVFYSAAKLVCAGRKAVIQITD